VCLGLPGALPRANRAAIDAAVRVGLALGCEIRNESVFARKNYFYPDMPKNYQITQYDRPLCEGGALPVRVDQSERRFELIRIHVEEDTGSRSIRNATATGASRGWTSTARACRCSSW
jgi:aspartyl-tRNA(Asn)/glutamyl-tRNA(Gln) amidotransferase subunit B